MKEKRMGSPPGGSVDFSMKKKKKNALVLEKHADLIPKQSKGLSLSLSLSLRGTETRLRDLWVVAFNPQSSLGVAGTTGE